MTIKPRAGLWVLIAAAIGALIITAVLRPGIKRERINAIWDHPLVERDLDMIRADTLRVLVMRDPLSWEQRPAAETGLDLELMERFAAYTDMVMKVVPMDHRDSMYLALQKGKGDVIAAQYAALPTERGWFACSEPYHVVHPMIARPRAEASTGKITPRPDTVLVSYWSPVRNWTLSRSAKPVVREVVATPEDLLMDVVIGKVPACLVSDATAANEGSRLPALEFIPTEGPGIPLCFAVRSNAPLLAQAMNAWMKDKGEEHFRAVLVDSYLDRMSKPGALRKRSMPVAVDSISPYDAEFRAHGQGFGWKWQLLTAMAWKESRFDSTAVSHMGAHGIMQFMPTTAVRFGLDTAVAVTDHIQAAKRYITRLDTLWMRAVPDRDQRLRFVLASYNAGPGHIIDAQRLAERLGLDPERWENNVERAVLLLAKPRYYMRPELKNGYCQGSQVFHYVRDIVALYHQLTGLPQREAGSATMQEDPIPVPPALEEVQEVDRP